MFTEYLKDKYTKLIKIYTYLYTYNLYGEYCYSDIIKVKERENYYFDDMYYNSTKSINCNLFIRKLELHKHYCKKIINIPVSLKKLRLGKNCCCTIDFEDKLPKLEELEFGFRCNSDIVSLPISLRKLYVGCEFNRSIDCLSKLTNLEELILSDEFNQPIISLPASLRELYLGWEFDHSIDFMKELVNLEILDISSYGKKITFLPKSLKKLTLRENQKEKIKCDISYIKEVIYHEC